MGSIIAAILGSGGDASKKRVYFDIALSSGAFGLQAIKSTVDTNATQSSVNNLQTTANNIKTDTQIMRGDLYNFKVNAEPKLDAKISSRASQASVDALASSVAVQSSFTKIETRPLIRAGTWTCTSSADFLVTAMVSSTTPGARANFGRSYIQNGNPTTETNFIIVGTDVSNLVMGGNGGTQIFIEAIDDGSGKLAGGFITMQTTPEATASCTFS